MSVCWQCSFAAFLTRKVVSDSSRLLYTIVTRIHSQIESFNPKSSSNNSFHLFVGWPRSLLDCTFIYILPLYSRIRNPFAADLVLPLSSTPSLWPLMVLLRNITHPPQHPHLPTSTLTLQNQLHIASPVPENLTGTPLFVIELLTTLSVFSIQLAYPTSHHNPSTLLSLNTWNN